MAKSRLLYGAVLAVTCALALWSGSAVLVVSAVLLLLLLPVLKLLLVLDAGSMRAELSVRKACPAGKPLDADLMVTHSRPLLAVGAVLLQVHWENTLLDQRSDQDVLLPMASAAHQFSAALPTQLCGRVRLSCPRVICTDLLGLCTARLPVPEECSTVIYPQRLTVDVSGSMVNSGWQESEQTYLNQRGQDTSEVFDLRAYAPGDDYRSIHWKLSGKTGNLLIREGSTPAQNRLALLVDLGHRSDGHEVSPELLNGAVALACSISRQLAEQGVAHHTLFSCGQQLYPAEVQNIGQYSANATDWMQLHVPELCGAGLQLFSAERLDRTFSRLICVTVDTIPAAASQLSQELNLALLCVTEGDDIHLEQKDNHQFFQVPVSMLNSHSRQIVL